ncbi:MAG: DUF47 domain-containing protein [Acidimicrobiales bacterium]
MRRRRAKPLARLAAFFRDVTGESAHELTAILAEHISVGLEAVQLAEKTIGDAQAITDVDDTMRDVEHRGDGLRRRLVAGLAQTLVTPLDREDLFRLSRSVDDVVDNVRDFSREWSLYRPESERELVSLLEIVGAGLGSLRSAVLTLGEGPGQATGYLLEAKRATNHVRGRFEEEVAELFAGAVTPEVLKHRELLRRLDVVGLRLGEAVDVAFDALVKRGEGLTPPATDRAGGHARSG